MRTCDISDQTVSKEGFRIYSPLDPSVQGLSVQNTSNVKSLPENLENIFPCLLVLEIYDFKIESVSDEDLRGLKNLKSLNLGSNEIEWISSDAFRDLCSLELLKLSNNKIEYLGANIFDETVNVQRLELNGNKIEFLRENIFQRLGNLKSVSLSFNKLSNVPGKLFQSNLKLECIDFTSNKIQFIIPVMFDHLKKLSYVNLEENDCIDKYYDQEALASMKSELSSKCQRHAVEDRFSVGSGCKTKVMKFLLLSMVFEVFFHFEEQMMF